MSAQKGEIVEWVAGHILPHERDLRAGLRRLGSDSQEIDDIVQDTYVHIAELSQVSHIRDARAYLFAAARSVLLKRVRRERIVRIDQLADSDMLAITDDAPSPEQRMQAREELARVTELVRELPPRCREIFEMRRIEGISQRAIAEQLGISEHMVEYEASRGLRLLVQALTIGEEDEGGRNIGRRALQFARRRRRQP